MVTRDIHGYASQTLGRTQLEKLSASLSRVQFFPLHVYYHCIRCRGFHTPWEFSSSFFHKTTLDNTKIPLILHSSHNPDIIQERIGEPTVYLTPRIPAPNDRQERLILQHFTRARDPFTQASLIKRGTPRAGIPEIFTGCYLRRTHTHVHAAPDIYSFERYWPSG